MWRTCGYWLQAVGEKYHALCATLERDDSTSHLIWATFYVLVALCITPAIQHLWKLLDKWMEKSIVHRLFLCAPIATATVWAFWEKMIQDERRKFWGPSVLYIWDLSSKKCEWYSFSREPCQSNPLTKYCPYVLVLVLIFCLVGACHRKN